MHISEGVTTRVRQLTMSAAVFVMAATLLFGPSITDRAGAVDPESGATPSRAQERTALTLWGGPFKIPDSPYRWRFRITRSKPGWILDIETSRFSKKALTELSDGWVFHLPRSAVKVGPGLKTATIDTGTSLGRYGRLQLRLGPKTKSDKTVRTCRKNGKQLSTRKRTIGQWRGRFAFRPHTDGLPAKVKARPIEGLVQKIVRTGASCPGPTWECAPFTSVHLRSGDSYFAALEDLELMLGATFREGEDVAPALRVYHMLFGYIDKSHWLDVGGSTVGLDFTGSGRFSDGSITLDKGEGVHHPPVPRCDAHTRWPLTWNAGEIALRLTPGTMTFDSNIDEGDLLVYTSGSAGSAASSTRDVSRLPLWAVPRPVRALLRGI